MAEETGGEDNERPCAACWQGIPPIAKLGPGFGAAAGFTSPLHEGAPERYASAERRVWYSPERPGSLMRPDSSIQWMAYPALLAAAAFAVGIAGAEAAALHDVRLWVAVGAAGAILWGGAAWQARRRLVSLGALGRTTGLAVLLVAAGGLRAASYRTPPPDALRQHANADRQERAVTVEGVVAGPPSRGVKATRLTLRATRLGTADSTALVTGQVRVTLQAPPWTEVRAPFPQVRSGDRIEVRGPLRPGPPPRNPGDFNYGAYLARRGICCTLHVSAPRDVRRTGETRTAMGEVLALARERIRVRIDRHVAHPSSQAILQALLLGDRGRVGTETRDQFADTGLMHLLAVSGLHVLLVGMVLYGLLRPALIRAGLSWRRMERTRAAVTVVVLGFYMLLTGARPSVVRAVVMAALLIGGSALQRSSTPLNTLGVAMALLLAARPPALLDAGFQLSMAAVAGIVVLRPRMMGWIPERWMQSQAGDWLANMTVVSLAATLATTPVLLYHFGHAPFAGLLLNTAAIPLTGLALTAGIATALTGGLPLVGASFGAAADLLVQGLVGVAGAGNTWLGSLALPATGASAWTLSAWVVGIVALAQWPRPRHRWRCVAGVFGLVVWGAWAPVLTGDAAPTLDVVFLDVGQGDAAVVRTPGGKTILVDAGPKTRYSDAGRSVVVPYLQRAGVERLDAVVVTHPDGDHLGGLPSVLRRLPTGRVFHSGQEATSSLYAESRQVLDSLSIPHRAVSAGDSILIDRAVHVHVLGPPRRPERAGLETENDASVVLRLTYGQTRMLFLGDVEARGEAWLAKRYGSTLASTVVTAAHHGSATSSTPELLRHVVRKDSTHAIISAGRRNAFGFPDPSVVRRWNQAGAAIHETAHRAVWMRSDGKSTWKHRWQE